MTTRPPSAAAPPKVMSDEFVRDLTRAHMHGLEQLIAVDARMIAMATDPEKSTPQWVDLYYKRFGIITKDTRADRVSKPAMPPWAIRRALEAKNAQEIEVTVRTPSQSSPESTEPR